jgi:hypothetical protein
MTLTILNLIFLHTPRFHYKLEVNIKYFFVESHQFNNFIIFKKYFDNHLFNITTCTSTYTIC